MYASDAICVIIFWSLRAMEANLISSQIPLIHFPLRDELVAQLKKQEGFVPHMYLDTEGVPTVGYGLNLRDTPFKQSWAEFILNDIVSDRYLELTNTFPTFRELSDVRKIVICNMSFQMGVGGLFNFHGMISALKINDYEAAAKAMMDSDWGRKYHARASQLSWMMEYDKFSMG